MVADDVLVRKAQSGDRAAYGELVRRHQDRVYNMALKMLNSPEDARDACQDTFIRGFRSLGGYDFRAAYTTWLYRIATNVCLDQLRRRGKEQQRTCPLGTREGLEIESGDQSPGPEELCVERERLKNLRRAVGGLPEGYRMALVLHHYQELSYREVAEIMELPEKTVATRIHRAKKMLREQLLGGEIGAVQNGRGEIKPLSGRRVQ